MRIVNEMRTFTEEASDLSARMQVVVDEIEAGKKTPEAAAKQLDGMARELKAITDVIKDLAYRHGRGEDRVSTIPVAL